MLCDRCFYARKKYFVDDEGNVYRSILCEKLLIYVYEEVFYNPFFKNKQKLLHGSKVLLDRRRKKCPHYREKLKPLTEYFKA